MVVNRYGRGETLFVGSFVGAATHQSTRTGEAPTPAAGVEGGAGVGVGEVRAKPHVVLSSMGNIPVFLREAEDS